MTVSSTANALKTYVSFFFRPWGFEVKTLDPLQKYKKTVPCQLCKPGSP